MSYGLAFGFPRNTSLAAAASPFSQLGPTLDLNFAGAPTTGLVSNNNSLDLNFVGNTYTLGAPYMVWSGSGMTAESFQDIITFSRATGNATYYNSSGYLTTAGVWNYLTYSNQPENAAWTKSNSFIQTNLLLQSQTFNDAAWVKNQAGVGVVPVVTADQGTAPDGTLTADRIQLNCVNNTSATNRCFISPLSLSYPSGSNYTASIYVKAFDASNVGKTIRFAVDGLNSIVYTLTANWQRITMTGLASTTVVNFLIETRGTYTDQTADLLMWGAQLVQGSVPGDYQATTSAALPVLYADYNGALRARKFCENNAATIAHFMDSSSSTIAAGVFTGFAKIKAGEHTSATMYLVDSVGIVSGTISTFNLTTGVVTTGTQASIVSVGGGYFQCAIYGTFAAGAGARVRVLLSNGSAYTGDGSSGIYIADAQLNDGSSALSYYNTDAYAYNAPRFDYDPVTLVAKGLLIEEQRTNLLYQSNDFTNAAWSKSLATVTANATTAPDGTFTADSISANSTSYPSTFVTVTTVASTSYTLSIYAKSNTTSQLSMEFRGSGSTPDTVFNLSSGTVTSGTGTILSVGNGWYRCSITKTSVDTSELVIIGLGFGPAVSDSIYIWGAQLETGAFASSYIPTVASQLTRAIDVANLNTLSPWFNQAAGTVFGNSQIVGRPTNSTNPFFSLSGSSGNLVTYNNSTNTDSISIFDGTNSAGAGGTGVSAIGTPRKFATAYGSAGLGASWSGNTAATAAYNGSFSGATSAVIASTGKWNGWILRLSYYPRRLTDTELQTLTT